MPSDTSCEADLAQSPPRVSRSAWDADDDEFDSEVYTDLKRSIETFKSRNGTFDRSSPHDRPHDRPHFSVTYAFRIGTDQLSLKPERNFATLRSTASQVLLNPSDKTGKVERSGEGEHKDPSQAQMSYNHMVAELSNPSCMSPSSNDLHDDIVQNLFINAYSALPVCLPPRHMHIISIRQLISTNDTLLMKYALPRLCDAVATTLFESSPDALDAFLDPQNKTFEWWRRTHATSLQPSVVIRRVDHEVLVGIFRTHGFKYLWNYHVRSIIDLTGKWSETFATSSTSTTSVTKDGPDWNSFEIIASGNEEAVNCGDPQFALWIGRQLAKKLLVSRMWDFDFVAGDECEWVVGEKVTRVRMRGRTDRDGSGGGGREEE